MTRADLCRQIAEKLEPKPESLVKWEGSVSPAPEWSGAISTLGFWLAKFVRFDHLTYPPNQIGYPEAIYEWQPFKPFTSEDDSARLLEAMPDPQLQHLMMHDTKRMEWFCAASVVVTSEPYECDEEDYPLGQARHPDRKTAIVLAAKAWLGIEGEVEL